MPIAPCQQSLPHLFARPTLILGVLVSLVILGTLGQSLMSLQVSAEVAPPATFPAFVLVESTETGYPRLVSYRRWQQHGKHAGWQPHRDAGRFHTAHLTADYRATPTGADDQSYRVVIHYWQHLWLEAGRIAYQVSGNTPRDVEGRLLLDAVVMLNHSALFSNSISGRLM